MAKCRRSEQTKIGEHRQTNCLWVLCHLEPFHEVGKHLHCEVGQHSIVIDHVVWVTNANLKYFILVAEIVVVVLTMAVSVAYVEILKGRGIIEENQDLQSCCDANI